METIKKTTNQSINFKQNEIIAFYGYYHDNGVTYLKNGIRQHKPTMDSFFYKYSVTQYKTGKFVNAETGEITDEFWGNANDFNIWFLAKVGRNEKFFFYLNPHKNETAEMLIHQVSAYIGKNNEEIKFRVNKLGEWTIMENASE